MKIFIHEFVTGGALLGAQGLDEAGDKLATEGRAMLTAVATDFNSLPDVETCITWDARLSLPPSSAGTIHVVSNASEELETFRRLSAEADYTLVIAPEIDGALLQRCEEALRRGAKLLGPSLEFIRLASDKQATAEALTRAGVPCPAGGLTAAEDPTRPLGFPLVVKPRDGAGSFGARLVRNSGQWKAAIAGQSNMRYERYHEGQPASVAVISGPGVSHILAPCAQRLDGESLAYIGGSCPLVPELAQRARRLAQRVVEACDAWGACGYWGIDMVLGAYDDDDVVVEINPRLTTSYVGLRALAEQNLAGVILAAVEGRGAALSFRSDRIEFDANGCVRRAPTRVSSSTHAKLS